MRQYLFAILVISTFLLWVTTLASDFTNRFGFTGPEIFPIENGISQMKVADLDADGLLDLVVVNNARSKINLLYNQTGKTNDPVAVNERMRLEINDLPPDARFRIQAISSEKRISSLLVADLNKDQRPDLAYYGEPRELIIQLNEGGGKWGALKRFPISDGSLDPYALVSGDLNGDQRTDILLLADAHIYYLQQKPDATLNEPEKIPYIGVVKSLQVLDIQGDSRDDLLLVNWDNLSPFRFRLQTPAGKLGPEFHFTLPPIRSYWADDLDADRKTEVITIAQKSGRAQLSTFVERPAEELSSSWKQGQFHLLPLLKTSKTRRGILWHDLDNDGLTDLLVAEPESGQLTLALQEADGAIHSTGVFASLTGITEISAADWDQDQKPDIFILSSDERQVGVTSLDEKGRIAFPKMLWMDGRPLVIAAGILEQGKPPLLAAIVENEGKRELQLRSAEGVRRRQSLSESFKANPSSLLIHDVDQDGHTDFIVLAPYEKIKILLQIPGENFKEIDVAPLGGNTDQPWVTLADVDGDGKKELLLPQRNFLRAVVLRSDEGQNWTFEVKEQINGAGSSSRIRAAGPLQKDGAVPALVLLDQERKALTFTERNENGVWQVTRNVSLPITDFHSLETISLGAASNAVALLGLNMVGWLGLSGEVWELAELHGYETPIKDGYLHDVVSGDLNHDGRKDLVFLETARSYLDLVTLEAGQKLRPANRWQVFEERTFRSRRNDLAEPREAVIADLTGDGKNDLAVVVHDRILLYPQE